MKHNKNVIHIFGAAGSGTTTLGRMISERLGYKHMDTDDYYWLPTEPHFTEKRAVEERIALMKYDIEKYENVVISGSLADWGDVLIPYFTLAVRITLDTDIRIERIKSREKLRFGARIEPGGDMYIQHLDFLEWTKLYDTGDLNMRSKAKHDQWQKLLPCPILHLDGSEPKEVKLQKVLQLLIKQKSL